MRRLALLVALMAVGCGSESAPPPPKPTPERAPTYPAVIAWLEERSISVDSSRYDRLVARFGEDFSVLAIGPEHAADLRRLHPSERALTRYYYAFTEEGFGEAGQSMLDWLRIFRLAAERTDARHVVLIPLVD